MRLRREEFAGTGKVFAFTLQQMVCSKANIISIVIILLISLLSMPILTIAKGDELLGGEKESSEISRIYYINDTNWDWKLENLGVENTIFVDVPVKEADASMKNLPKEVEKAKEGAMNPELDTASADASDVRKAEQEAMEKIYGKYLENDEVLLCADMQESEGVKAPVIGVYGIVDAELQELADAAAATLTQGRAVSEGVTSEQLAVAKAEYTTAVDTESDYLEEESSLGFDVKYGIQYGYAMILMILSMFTSSYIIRAIIEEKSSKLVELLMVSVKPLALVMGKILAVMVYVFGMLAAIAVTLGISSIISVLFLDIPSVSSLVESTGISTDALQIDTFLILAVLISLVLGYLTFSILSGLAGTSCSTMEDMESASMNVMLVILAGYMVSVFTINITDLAVVVSLIPILSVFCAPVEYALGNIGVGVLVGSWVIQLAVLAGLFLFCARIYKNLILYKGQKMKWLQMIRLARTVKKQEKIAVDSKKRGGEVG